MYSCTCQIQLIPLHMLQQHIKKTSLTHVLKVQKIQNKRNKLVLQQLSKSKIIKQSKELKKELIKNSSKVSIDILTKTLKRALFLKKHERLQLKEKNLSIKYQSEEFIENLKNLGTLSRLVKNKFLESSIKQVSKYLHKKKTITKNFKHFLTSHSGPFNSISLSTDRKFLMSGENSVVRLWKARNMTHLKSFCVHKTIVKILEIDKTSTFCLSCSQDNKICYINIKKRKLKFSIEDHNTYVLTLQICNNSEYFITTSNDFQVRIWGISNKSIIKTIFFSSMMIFAGTFKNSVFVFEIYGSVYNYDWNTLNYTKKFENKYNKINPHQIECCSIGHGIAVMGSVNGKIYLINLESLESVTEPIQAHSNSIYSVDICKINKLFISSSLDSKIKVWELQTYELIKTIDCVGIYQTCAKLNQNRIYYCTESSNIFVINFIHKKYINEKKFKHYISIAISPKFMMLAYACKSLRLINLKNNEELKKWRCTDKITSIIFKSSFIICGTSTGEVYVMAVPELRVKVKYYFERTEILFIKCSNDFKKLVISSKIYTKIINLEGFHILYKHDSKLIAGDFDKTGQNFYFIDSHSNLYILENLSTLKKFQNTAGSIQLFVSISCEYIFVKNWQIIFSLYSTQEKKMIKEGSKTDVLDFFHDNGELKEVLFHENYFILSDLVYGLI